MNIKVEEKTDGRRWHIELSEVEVGHFVSVEVLFLSKVADVSSASLMALLLHGPDEITEQFLQSIITRMPVLVALVREHRRLGMSKSPADLMEAMRVIGKLD